MNKVNDWIVSKIVPHTCKKYGCNRSSLDHRDFKYTLKSPETQKSLPKSVDLRESNHLPPVYAQGDIGSCTANAIGGALEYDRSLQGLGEWMPSRLFIYYNERVLDNTVYSDAGSTIRTGMTVVHKQGYAKSELWPYIETKYTVKPPKAAYTDASHHITLQYSAVNHTENDIKLVLGEGYPIVFGFVVFKGLESESARNDGHVPIPEFNQRPLGGHAVMLVGYDDNSQNYIFRNSWGASWGDGGYGYLPYAYINNPKYAMDFWVIRHIKG